MAGDNPMTDAPVMPLWVGDYLSDTLHLTLEQHGAYTRILMVTWNNGCKPLPDDAEYMHRMLGCSRQRWFQIREKLAPFFDLSEGTWRSRRLELEWRKLQEKRKQQSENAKRRYEAKPLNPNGGGAATAEPRQENGSVSAERIPSSSKKEGSVSSAIATDTVVAGATRSLGREQAEAMVAVWNAICAPPLSRPRRIDGTRQTKLLRRLGEDFGSELAQWEAYCRRVRASPHLCGENDRRWTADLDWVLEPRNINRILEGRYDPRGPRLAYAQRSPVLARDGLPKSRNPAITSANRDTWYQEFYPPVPPIARGGAGG
jgi:uncharacterized protein YdaU (DUF1376 family)